MWQRTGTEQEAKLQVKVHHNISIRMRKRTTRPAWKLTARKLRMRVRGGADGQRSCEMNFAAEINTWRSKVLRSQMASFQIPLGKLKHSNMSCRLVHTSHTETNRTLTHWLLRSPVTAMNPSCSGTEMSHCGCRLWVGEDNYQTLSELRQVCYSRENKHFSTWSPIGN